MPTTITAEQKSLSSPDEVRVFEKGRVDLVNIGGGTVGPPDPRGQGGGGRCT